MNLPKFHFLLVVLASGCGTSDKAETPNPGEAPDAAVAAPPSDAAARDAENPVNPADASPLGEGGKVTPAGCAYTFTPAPSRGFTQVAADDPAAVGSAPIRVRLGLGGSTVAGAQGYADPTTSAVFTWETAATSRATKVRMGTAPGALSDVHAGISWTTPAAGDVAAFMHEVHVCGLLPGTTYYYEVGGPDVWSATQTFTTVPTSGTITLGVSGDARDSADVFQMVQLRMRDAAVAMQLFSGDMVLVGAQESLFAQFLDKAWKDPTDPTKFLTLGQQLIVPVAGNHENESAQFYGNFALPGDGPYAESFASFDVGNAHVVTLDDQAVALAAGGAEATAQLAFLDQDLAKADANRAARPFVVVMSHRGLASTAKHGSEPDTASARAALAPLWDKYHVDLVLNGHDHEYARTSPIALGSGTPTLASPGTIYAISGGAGALPSSKPPPPAPFLAATAVFGSGTPYVGLYQLITLSGRKLSFKAYGLKASGGGVAGDTVVDAFELTR